MALRIISGGQTGVDRAALEAAESLNLIHGGGWCPKGRLAEDGEIPKKYHFQETSAANYQERTEWNVRDSDATLILTLGEPKGGTLYTVEMAKKHNKPYFICYLEGNKESNFDAITAWFSKSQIETVNVAGPRASEVERIYDISLSFLFTLFLKIVIGREEKVT